MITADFTPTKETVSLHGLGFIQLILPANKRLHVWHPILPRRTCYDSSSCHNHRFGFESMVLRGTLINQRIDIQLAREDAATHKVISHNGPRMAGGGRESFTVAFCNLIIHGKEYISSGERYTMLAGHYHRTISDGIVVTAENPAATRTPFYHRTISDGIVVTLMTKLDEGLIHANTICAKDVDFDIGFDRFQMSTDELMDVVKTSLLG